MGASISGDEPIAPFRYDRGGTGAPVRRFKKIRRARGWAAASLMCSLVSEAILTPGEDRIEIKVRGDLAGILSISAKRKKPAFGGGLFVYLVAGVGFEPTTFRL